MRSPCTELVIIWRYRSIAACYVHGLCVKRVLYVPLFTFQWGRTPLITASKRGYFRTVQLLIEKGANVNQRDWVCHNKTFCPCIAITGVYHHIKNFHVSVCLSTYLCCVQNIHSVNS